MQTALEAFRALHEGLAQQGPGSDASTRRALGMIADLPDEARILDLGCGPGRQTLELARRTPGRITAVDLLAEFLDLLRGRAAAEGFAERIDTLRCSMTELELPDASIDLIWCEGAIYEIGFREGLRAWKSLLRPGGTLAVSDLVWTRDARPASAQSFWSDAYPKMQSLEAHRITIEEEGFRRIGDFSLPERDWFEGYYDPLEARIARHQDAVYGEEARRVFDGLRREIDEFRSRDGAYEYVFFIMQSPG